MQLPVFPVLSIVFSIATLAIFAAALGVDELTTYKYESTSSSLPVKNILGGQKCESNCGYADMASAGYAFLVLSLVAAIVSSSLGIASSLRKLANASTYNLYAVICGFVFAIISIGCMGGAHGKVDDMLEPLKALGFKVTIGDSLSLAIAGASIFLVNIVFAFLADRGFKNDNKIGSV